MDALRNLTAAAGLASDRARCGAPRRRAGPRGSLVARAVASVVRACGAQGVSLGRQRLCGEDGGRTQSAVRGPVVPPVFRRTRRAGRAAGAAFARLRRDRRCSWACRHQQPRHRRRERDQGVARRQARVRRGDRPQRSALRPCRAAASRGEGAFPRHRSAAIPMRCRWAMWCSRSAIRSASGRRSPTASSRRWRARRSASPTISSSSRPTRRSIPAIRAARWSISPAV